MGLWVGSAPGRSRADGRASAAQDRAAISIPPPRVRARYQRCARGYRLAYRRSRIGCYRRGRPLRKAKCARGYFHPRGKWICKRKAQAPAPAPAPAVPPPAPQAPTSTVLPWHEFGRTSCLPVDESSAVGETFTHPPRVRAFNDTAGPDPATVWFHNRYYFLSTAGWKETYPQGNEWKSSEWYSAGVVDYESPRYWVMRNNTGLDYLGAEEQLRVSWNPGFTAAVAQEIVWMRPDGRTPRARTVLTWTAHQWGVAVNVRPTSGCSF